MVGGLRSVFSERGAMVGIAYLAMLLVPWGLVFNRGLADGACVATCLLFLLHSRREKSWQWLADPVVRAGVLAWLWMVATSLFALEIKPALSSAAPWIRFVLFYAAAVYWVLKDRKALYVLAGMLMVMFALISVDTLWQYASGTSLTGNPIDVTGRLTGPFDNVKVGIYLSKLLLPVLAIGLYVCMAKKQRSRLVGLSALVSLVLVCILLSGERTAFASASLGLLLAGVGFARLYPSARKALFLLGVTVCVAAASVAATQPWVQARLQETQRVFENVGNSPYGKLVVAGYRIGMDHMLTGVGLKNFERACLATPTQGELYCNLHPHNVYMEWFAAGGVAGLVMFLGLLFALVKVALATTRLQPREYKLMGVFALALLVLNFFPLPAQSMFSNWPAILQWYGISVMFATLTAFSDKREG